MNHSKLGSYHLLKSIGKGGMGEVLLAKKPGALGFSKIVAIKRILPDLNLNQTITELFLREAQISIQLNHPNIISMYEVGQEDNSIFLVMEFLSGVSLLEIIQASRKQQLPFTIGNALQVGLSVLSGLDYAHRFKDPSTQKNSPIIHCDICPQNILVGFEGELKIIDFGVAKIEGRDGRSGPIWGKVNYMSPEHLIGRGLNERSDIFSAGVLLWELLTLEDYYSDSTPLEIRSKILNSHYARELPTKIAFRKELQDIFSRMITIDPDIRYNSVAEVLSDLRLLVSEKSILQTDHQFHLLLQEVFAEKLKDQRDLIAQLSSSPDSLQLNQTSTTTLELNKFKSNTNRSLSGMMQNDHQYNREILNVFSHLQTLPVEPKADRKTNKVRRPTPPYRSISRRLKRLGLVLSLIAFLLYFFDLIPAIWIYKVSKPLGLYRQPASFSDAIPEFDIRKSNKNEGVLFLIDSDPREAQIIVDGKRIYRRTPLRLRTEPGKKMLIRLEKRGYAFVEKPVNTLSESFKPNLIPTFKVEDSDR